MVVDFSSGIISSALASSVLAAGDLEPTWIDQALKATVEHLGPLLISVIAVVLLFFELRAKRHANSKALKERLEFDKSRFAAEAADREKISKFRDQEMQRLIQPVKDIATHLAQELIRNPQWASQALESAKFLPYSNTLFGERSEHFREEKKELAERFVPYLLRRCEFLTREDRHVFLLIDAGTTLFQFFEILGQESVRRCHQGEDWLQRVHLATNNLPGIEQLIKSGRRAPWDRYSSLAIQDCHLLPGVPIPIFGAVAGDETNAAIEKFKTDYSRLYGENKTTFIALVVGNWVRLRTTAPRCPVPMARGKEHLAVKQSFINCADEIFVISTLGKIFVERSSTRINEALGFSPSSTDPERAAYEEVLISEELAPRVKLVSTTRSEGRLLRRHSNKVEDWLQPDYSSAPYLDGHLPLSREQFSSTRIEQLPHLFFPFTHLPKYPTDEACIEFPHFHTRHSADFLRLFSVDTSAIYGGATPGRETHAND